MTVPSLEPVDRRPTASLVAEAVRNHIIDGAFTPGMQLTEAHLAEQLRVSRGPVREAFQRLIQEGLLVSEPHRGVFVVTLDDDDVADLYLARRAIEREAAAQVVRRADPDVLRRLDALVKVMAKAAERGTWAAVADADLQFHETLVHASGSPRLRRMYATLLVETRLCLIGLRAAYPDPATVVDEHGALVRALGSGDEAAVLSVIDQHLDRAVTGPAEAAPA